MVKKEEIIHNSKTKVKGINCVRFIHQGPH